MIFGIGTDIIEIKRVENLIQKYGNQFLSRTFTPKEIEYCSRKYKYESYAVRVAAKEALFKAAGTGWRDGLKWTDFEILNDKLGKPFVNIYGKAQEIFKDCHIHISLSHNQTQAVAFVIVEK